MQFNGEPIFISESKVKNVLNWPLVNEAVEQALKSACRQEKFQDFSYSCQPARSFTFTQEKQGVLLSMPGFVGNYSLNNKKYNTLACKLVTCFNGNELKDPPMPNILANILLFDNNTGNLNCIMNGTEITAWRTAGASIVATKYLYFSKFNQENKQVIVSIIGCGVQGSIHAIGFCSSFKEISEIRLWNRTITKAQYLADKLEKNRSSFLNKNLKIKITSNVNECVFKADIIITATFSSKPLLYCNMLKDEVHINAIGAGVNHHSEISEDLYKKCSIYIDNWASAKTELKDLKAEIIGELGDLIINGKTPKNGITVFQSMGMASEDATVAQAVYEKIKSENFS